MNKRSEKAQVVSFVSGKGGVGKTSTVISLGHLLQSMGIRTLIIDFDLTTNGASYFFKNLYQRNQQRAGLSDLIFTVSTEPDFVLSESDIEKSVTKVEQELYFIPSRVNFNKKVDLYGHQDHWMLSRESVLKEILRYGEDRYDLILIDNQAGANATSSIATSQSDKAIIMTEQDVISNDAVENLLIQIGDRFPSYRRQLVNKLHLEEGENYIGKLRFFNYLNGLPPLPFDFGVKRAFSLRKIPINVNEVSPFLIVLFSTAKAFLPEFEFKFKEYSDKINNISSEYSNNMKKLVREKEAAMSKRSSLMTTGRNGTQLVFLGAATTMLIITGVVALDQFFGTMLYQNIYMFFGLSTIVLAAIVLHASNKSRTREGEVLEERKKIRSSLEKIDKELRNYKSFKMSESIELLKNFESHI
ncbi:MAG: ParA family protein [Roseivirga sp.]|nr:ParA family protein [Roseivirga sp.]